MFNGRINEVGVLLETGRRLLVRAPKTSGSLATGGSVSVSGTCLSVVEIGEDWFATCRRRPPIAALLPSILSGPASTSNCRFGSAIHWTGIWSRAIPTPSARSPRSTLLPAGGGCGSVPRHDSWTRWWPKVLSPWRE